MLIIKITSVSLNGIYDIAVQGFKIYLETTLEEIMAQLGKHDFQKSSFPAQITYSKVSTDDSTINIPYSVNREMIIKPYAESVEKNVEGVYSRVKKLCFTAYDANNQVVASNLISNIVLTGDTFETLVTKET